MTTSLALLPQRQPDSAASKVNLPQRPRLQIDTQQLFKNRTFGKGGSTSLRLDTLSAASPTVRNTFSNAYEAPTSAAPTLDRPSKPRLGLSIDSSVTKPLESNSNPPSSITPNSASTFSSVLTSASSNASATIAIPYKQPHNLASILSNSPARQLIPRKMAPARPLFPAEKKVSFRTPLEEEIKTTKYTLAHSDLESSISSNSTISSIETATSSSDSSSASLSIQTASSSEASSSSNASSPPRGQDARFSSLDTSPRLGGPRTGDKRDSSDSDSDSCPETPVAGRRKRRRDWRWTLGPLPSSSDKSTSTSDATTSDDSS
ncbi:hypothetical protein BU24DRAFT_407145 [Aaosphaeria arxii CBS 175.79]|uniref:Uncharacterized protein n=1 Tax=Aaosphaeria arxii CBS 175.79 TaxID=1450172 RepID=A0A6A5XW52_9PLEO|nr:uncharacterized protein BU24DRAFT_407145 [Aaosphaeria arxii CBS 175.79]KAF2017067.1 hypothetical protein BU24DRAFT_407145 [Aaosphaeria arxii CBS 175.79]